jgi:type VI secretion system protein ImpG
MSFDALYREELAFLREMGRAIALERPGLCDTLAQPGTDPDVERLLEGFAMLAARTRARADDAVPEAIDAIAEVVAPHAVRPVPASVVMQLTPKAALVRDRVHVTRGAAFGSRLVDGTRCEVRSTAPIDLLPLTIERSLLEHANGAQLVTSLHVSRAAIESLHVARPLRFFLHAPLAIASQIAHAIDRHLVRVELRTSVGVTRLSAALVDPDREPHLPWPPRAPEAGRHLLEHAYFPERHLFFDVTGLERVPTSHRAERFEIALAFDRLAALPDRIAPDALRLHCVPAVNVFPISAEPIRWHEAAREAPLRAAGLPTHATEVYEVDAVVGLAEGSRARTTYRSAADLGHLESTGAFFALRRARSPLDGGVDTFLHVGGRSTRANETLSIELRCTNRRAIGALRAGDLCEPIVGSPATATFTNLAAPGPHASAPVGSAAIHALVGASAACAVVDASSLRAWLAPHAVGASSDLARARAVASLAAAIRQLRVRPFRAMRRGVVERGESLTLELDESHVPSIGEAFLFSRALDRALACTLPLNVRQRLDVVLAPSGRRIAFDARGEPERS